MRNGELSATTASMQDSLITYRGAVYPWHCDHMGHMNVTWYVAKFDEATWNLFAHVGLTPSSLRDSNHGMAGLEQHITYERELLAGDVIFVRSWVLEARSKVLRLRHEMFNGESEERAATMEQTAVYIDRAARKSRPLPAAVLERAKSLVQSPPSD